MANPVDINDQNFDEQVLQSDQPVIVDFWAEWCAPCRAISPIIKDLAKEYDGRIKVMKINVDEAQQVAGRYGIRAIPAVLAFQNGQVVGQLQGARPKRDFDEMAKKLL